MHTCSSSPISSSPYWAINLSNWRSSIRIAPPAFLRDPPRYSLPIADEAMLLLLSRSSRRPVKEKQVTRVKVRVTRGKQVTRVKVRVNLILTLTCEQETRHTHILRLTPHTTT